MLAGFSNEIKATNAEKVTTQILRQIMIIKEEINEIVRACQMAKGGLVNSNVLDRDEIHRIVDEITTLPYANELEAVEYAKPKVLSNGTTLLYVLSLPKVREVEYNYLIVKPVVRNGKKINLPYNTLMVNEHETFGVLQPCLQINDNTVCEEKSLKKLSEQDCVPTLIKGGEATCTYESCDDEIIELVMEDTIFISNYNGNLYSNNFTKLLSGTYAIRLNNEEVRIRNNTYSSHSKTKVQILPQVVTTIAKEKRLLDLGYLHNISLHNIERLENLAIKHRYSLAADTTIFLVLALLGFLCWKALYSKRTFPPIRSVTNSSQEPTICGTQIFGEGGVNTTELA